MWTIKKPGGGTRGGTGRGPCAPQCFAECDFGEEGHGVCAAQMARERVGCWERTPLMLRVIGYADQRRRTFAPWQLGGGFDGWEYGDGTLAPERAAVRGVFKASVRYLVHVGVSGVYWVALVNALGKLSPYPAWSLKQWLMLAVPAFVIMILTSKD